MDTKQSFNLNADFLEGFSSIFVKLVLIIIAVYLFIMIINFLRDKFIHKEPVSRREDILDLLTILHKLLFVSGFGFIIGNIAQIIFSEMTRGNYPMPSIHIKGEWEYLTFGIILIFIGIGFKAAKKMLKKESVQ